MDRSPLLRHARLAPEREVLAALTADETDHIDLRDVRFWSPALLAGSAAVAQRLRRSRRALVLRAPRDPEAAHYAARMRLGDVLDRLGIYHDLPPRPQVERHGPGEPAARLLELAPVRSVAEVEALSRLVHATFAGHRPGLARALHQSVGEIATNVLDHSHTTGFVVAQTMPGLRELRLAVCDGGIGLRASLARHHPVHDHAAVALAVSGVSRLPDPDRGTGLSTTLDLVTRRRGSVLVLSGTACWQLSATERLRTSTASPFRGTLIEARIPIGAASDASMAHWNGSDAGGRRRSSCTAGGSTA